MMNKDFGEVLDIGIFNNINIHFPGDVYILAVWLVMSDQAKSTRANKKHTMLIGLASAFSSLYGPDYSNPLDTEDVMAVFESHGIKGNPALIYDDKNGPLQNIALTEK